MNLDSVIERDYQSVSPDTELGQIDELCRVDLAVVKKDPREHDHERDHTHNGKKDDILSLALQHALQRQKDIQTAFGVLQRKMVLLKTVGF